MAAVTIARTRWWVKKAARQGMAFGTWAGGALVGNRSAAPPKALRALTYHRIGHIPHDPFCMTPADFEQQIRWLAERGALVSLDQVERFVRDEDNLPPDAVLITIDDGYHSTYAQAMPILRRYGAPAVAFVTAGLIESREPDNAAQDRFMTWDELAQLPDANIAVGSHAHNHRSLGALPPGEAAEEAERSRALLEQRLGRPVRSFAYPYGTRGDFTPATETLLRKAGYTIAFNSMHGAIRPGDDPVSLPRVKVEAGDSFWMFKRLCQGAMDRWRIVDENLWRLQRVR
jgi:peptidoglycan/xylan/chitin deacetylase (PgdA/CDA1 family)